MPIGNNETANQTAIRLQADFNNQYAADSANKDHQEMVKEERRKHNKVLELWKTTKPKLVAAIIYSTLSKKSQDRIIEFNKERYLVIIQEDDIMDLLLLIKESHTHKGSTLQQTDKDDALVAWVNWGQFPLKEGTTLEKYYDDYRKVIRRCNVFGIITATAPQLEDVMSRYLTPLKTHPNNFIRTRVVEYCINRNDPSKYPTDIDEVHKVLLLIDQTTKGDIGINTKVSSARDASADIFFRDANGDMVQLNKITDDKIMASVSSAISKVSSKFKTTTNNNPGKGDKGKNGSKSVSQ